MKQEKNYIYYKLDSLEYKWDPERWDYMPYSIYVKPEEIIKHKLCKLSRFYREGDHWGLHEVIEQALREKKHFNLKDVMCGAIDYFTVDTQGTRIHNTIYISERDYLNLFK